MPMQPYIVQPRHIWLKALIYGSPGVGKTSMAATVQDHPNLRDACFINIEGGLLSVAGRGDIRAVDPENIPEVEEFLQSFTRGSARWPGFDTVKTLIMDSGSELSGVSLQSIAQAGYEAEVRRTRGNTQRSRNFVDRSEHGENTIQVTRIFRLLRDLPVHAIVTSLPRTSRDQATDTIVEIAPAFAPGIRDTVIGYYDMVWYMYRDASTGQRLLLTEEQGVFRAKTRGHHFAQTIGQVTDITNFAELYDILIRSETERWSGNGTDEPMTAQEEVTASVPAARVVRRATDTQARTLNQARREAATRGRRGNA